MLIDERNHRVKTTLSTVQSIVAQALRRPAESITPTKAAADAGERFRLISRLHAFGDDDFI